MGRGLIIVLAGLLACTAAKPPPAAPPPVVAAGEGGGSAAPVPPPGPPYPESPYPPVQGPGVIFRGPGQAPLAQNPAECQACGGSWGPQGITGTVGCECRPPDAGKPCHGPLECQSECVIMVDDWRYQGVRCGPAGCNGPELVGECSPSYTGFGCLGRILELPTPEGPVREMHKICRD